MSSQQSETPDWDVVFLSATNSARSPSRLNSYEKLVSNVIDICEDRDFSLAIKLHPTEDGAWYSKRDWGQFVHEFEDIDRAILNSQIMITNASSAFIESAVMDTPVIVADLWDFGLERLGPLSNVYFIQDRDKMESTIVDIVQSQATGEKIEGGDSNEIIPIGGSVDRIIRIVTSR